MERMSYVRYCQLPQLILLTLIWSVFVDQSLSNIEIYEHTSNLVDGWLLSRFCS